MRRSLAILLAAATAITASAASFAPTQAAPIVPQATMNGGEIVQINHRRHRDGRHHRRHSRHHHHNNFGAFPGFFFSFGFPQAYYQPRRYYRPYYSDCFRTWDGQLICR